MTIEHYKILQKRVWQIYTYILKNIVNFFEFFPLFPFRIRVHSGL